jgi:hypothetical protein
VNAARLTSPRLQRVLAALRGGRPLTTRAIIRKAGVCAVNAIVAELRQHGAVIRVEQRRDVRTGRRRWFYTLIEEPRTE